jgi:Ser/Thr protein kinase RdoA (MazF antagonist)
MAITAQVHRYLTEAPSSHFLGQPVEMLAHWTGHDHLLWRVACRGQEAVLKLYLGAGQARSRRQYDGQQLFAPMGLAPVPLWVDRYPEGLSRQMLVYVWTPGEPMRGDDAETMAALAHAIAHVHSSDATHVRRMCPHPLNLDYFWRVLAGGLPPLQRWLAGQPALEAAVLFEALTTQAARLVESAPAQWLQTAPIPVHGDLRLENAIDSFGAVVLLDWEMFGLGDPALEVATFLHWSQSEIDERGQETWLNHYFAGFDQPGLAQRVALYRRLLPFQAACFLLNGLAEYGDEPAKAAELAASLPDLAATLAAALRQAATALDVDEDDIDALVQEVLAAPGLLKNLPNLDQSPIISVNSSLEEP